MKLRAYGVAQWYERFHVRPIKPNSTFLTVSEPLDLFFGFVAGEGVRGRLRVKEGGKRGVKNV